MLAQGTHRAGHRPRRHRRRAGAVLPAQQDRRAAAREVGGADQAVLLHPPGVRGDHRLPHLPGDPDLHQQLQGPVLPRVGRHRELHRPVELAGLPGHAVQHPALDPDRAGGDGRPRPRRRHPRRPAAAHAARSSPRRSSSCRWRSAWSAPPRSGASSTTPPRRARSRSASRTPSLGAVRRGPRRLAAAEPVPPQQPAADGGAAVVAGRLLDGAALGRGQGRARSTPWRPPASTAPASGRSSSGSSCPRSRARSSRCSSP